MPVSWKLDVGASFPTQVHEVWQIHVTLNNSFTLTALIREVYFVANAVMVSSTSLIHSLKKHLFSVGQQKL